MYCASVQKGFAVHLSLSLGLLVIFFKNYNLTIETYDIVYFLFLKEESSKSTHVKCSLLWTEL